MACSKIVNHSIQVAGARKNYGIFKKARSDDADSGYGKGTNKNAAHSSDLDFLARCRLKGPRSKPDLVFKVDGKSVYVHKKVIKSHCELFDGKLEHKRRKKERLMVVEVNDYDYLTVLAMVDVIYDLGEGLVEKRPEQSLALASEYGIEALKASAVRVLTDELDTSNVNRIAKLARSTSAPDLYKACKKFMAKSRSLSGKSFDRLDDTDSDSSDEFFDADFS